ncbi:MAG: aminopeptidase P family protein [Geminicoccaceae bacterium]|nr:aminopeptidase P family protein [Geminicoccaceae bacterium]
MTLQPFAGRLALLRAELVRLGIDGLYLQRTDPHGSEYLPASEQRVAWLTGFTGSAGIVTVTADKAAVFSDGRYTVQLDAEVDGALYERRHIGKDPPAEWLASNVPEGGTLGIDLMLTRKSERDRLGEVAARIGGKLIGVDDPIDAVWHDRPPPPLGQVFRLDERFAGESGPDKRVRIGKEIAKAGAGSMLVTAADHIAWLLNVRGDDIPFNPVCLSFVLLSSDGRCRWFVDPRKLPADLNLEADVEVATCEALEPAFLELKGRKVLVDPATTHLGFSDMLERSGAVVVEAADPILLAKARKNPIEISGAIAAQRRDGAAMVRFLAWLASIPLDGTVSEMDASARLSMERSKDPLFRGPSFETISAHGPNAALPHYRTMEKSNRPLTGGAIYLVDSGGQYPDGTTDVTRTLLLGGTVGETVAEFRRCNTLVLKGHVALATAVFPKGTTGAQLDTFARMHLWRAGLDFDHGTGHGIGAYLCVHEGPQRIAKTSTVALEPGMIVSNEPGYYRAAHFGIRIENLVLVTAAAAPSGGERDLLRLETLTLVPIDRSLMDLGMLTTGERRWVDTYHQRVLAELSPLLDEDHRHWLEAACAPLK